MKTIGNFTQTYKGTPRWSPGSDCKSRDFLIDAFCKDDNKINCYKLLDYPTFSFHNFDTESATRLNEKIKTVIPNIKSVCYQKMSFGSCILLHLNMLKNKGLTDFMWIQDDEFFTHTNFKDFAKFYEFYKNNEDIKHVNLLYPSTDFQNSASFDTKHISNDLQISRFSSAEMKRTKDYTMDFTAFICNIDYFLTNMFDDQFVNLLDAYQLEGAVLNKSFQNNVERGFLNVGFFESYNIVGMRCSTCKTGETLKKLQNNFL